MMTYARDRECAYWSFKNVSLLAFPDILLTGNSYRNPTLDPKGPYCWTAHGRKYWRKELHWMDKEYLNCGRIKLNKTSSLAELIMRKLKVLKCVLNVSFFAFRLYFSLHEIKNLKDQNST